MADGGEQSRAVLDEAQQPGLHAVEGFGGAADVFGAGLRQRSDVLAATQRLGRACQPAQGLGDAARGEHRDDRKHQGRQAERGDGLGVPEALLHRLGEGGVEPAAVLEPHGEAHARILVEIEKAGRARERPGLGPNLVPVWRSRRFDVGGGLDPRLRKGLLAGEHDPGQRAREVVPCLPPPLRGVGRPVGRHPVARAGGVAGGQDVVLQLGRRGFEHAHQRGAAAQHLALRRLAHHLAVLVPGDEECRRLCQRQREQGEADEASSEAAGPQACHARSTSASRL